MRGIAAGVLAALVAVAAEQQLLADVPRIQGWYDNVMNVTYSKDLSVTP